MMPKKFLYLLVTSLILTITSCTSVNRVRDYFDDKKGASTAPSYLAIESNSGRILYSYNANERRAIGMLTNIATAALIADWLSAKNIDPCRLIYVPSAATQASNTNKLNLKAGDKLSIRDALYSTILWDDTASAITLAYNCGYGLNHKKPLEAFVAQMNQLAQQLGMLNTFFKAPHGAATSRSTAKDLAILSLYVLQKPSIQMIGSQQSALCTIISRDGSSRQVKAQNTNRLVGYNPDVEGLKATISSQAGACLIATARKPSVKRIDSKSGKTKTYPQNMIIVILGMKDDARYRAANAFLKDGWGVWEEWRKTYTITDQNLFITLPTFP